jgi:hypothetical protein
MPYIGGSLKGLVEAVSEVTPLAAFAMADAGADYLHRQARFYTPIGPGRDGGHVYTAWEKVPVERRRVGGYPAWEGGARNQHYRVGWLEYGTAPRVIEPDDQQAIETPEGPRAAAHHPGTRGEHMMLRATLDLEANAERVLAPKAHAWAAAAEANARRKPGIR